MKNIICALLLSLAAIGSVSGQTVCAPPEGKLIYKPEKLQANDFADPNSQWSYCRMATTDDIVVFWERGFGNDLSQAPPLEGQPMTIDLDNLLTRLQSFYDFYRDSLEFILPGSKAERYRMMVMLQYSLEGTAYGGDYDGQIGALWIAPNRVQDERLNCIAHELGHSFQSQIESDHTGECWGGGGIFEMASQWMLWQVNPDWTTEENYHWQAFRSTFNKRFLDIENIYRSPYVLEYWSMRHGLKEIANLFRKGRQGEDPAQTYMRVHQLSLSEMNDEMADCYSRLISFDFPRVKESHRKMAGELVGAEPMGTWGFNVVELPDSVRQVTFESLAEDPNASFRYQLVALDKDANARYLGINSADKARLKIRRKAGERMYLVVVACPRTEYKPLLMEDFEPGEPQTQEDYRYKLTY
ncbi:MAG: DUF6055 domain-containing protein [Prevotellaceae bacterium]|nr:DUF6055 domain-containing protein [Prevotellaceae bacterium]